MYAKSYYRNRISSQFKQACIKPSKLEEKTMKWKYKDNRGIWQTGTLEKVSDLGGTDVTYFFKNESGILDVIPGPKLKRDDAKPIYNTTGD